MTTSPGQLRIIAAAVWYAGGLLPVLFGLILLGAALEVRPDPAPLLLAAGAGTTVGALAARFLLFPLCQRNVRRIDRLTGPTPWHCYEPRLLLLLVAIVALGSVLPAVAAGRYVWLVLAGGLDLALATAVLGGSVGLWDQSAPACALRRRSDRRTLAVHTVAGGR